MTDFGVLRVRGWMENYENNKTRILKTLNWLPIPVALDRDEYIDIVDHPNGAAHFGFWNALVQVAARCQPRGTFMRESGKPHTVASLARVTRIQEEVIEEAIPRLLSVRWLETWHPGAQQVPDDRHESAGGVPDEGQQRKRTNEPGRTVGRPDGRTEEAPSASAAAPAPVARVTADGNALAAEPEGPEVSIAENIGAIRREMVAKGIIPAEPEYFRPARDTSRESQ